MNTTTESRRTDEAMITYVEWLQLSVAVQDTYDHWRRGPRCDAAVSFAAYMQALDLEERSALEYAEHVAGSSSVGGEVRTDDAYTAVPPGP